MIAFRGVYSYYKSINGREKCEMVLSKSERSSYKELPLFVQEGLRNPYKRQFEVAFRFLIYVAPDDEKVWLQQLHSRNCNLFAVLSSTLLAVLLVSILSLTMENDSNSFDLSSGDARNCYIDLVGKMKDKNIITGDVRNGLSRDIHLQNKAAIWEIDERLREFTFPMEASVPMGRDEEDTINTIIEELRSNSWACYNTSQSSKVVPQRPWGIIAVSVAAMFLFVFCLSVAYALVLRNTIASALEMLWLRRGISSEENDANPQ